MTQGILRIATAGSVDNGKSTLIGRLLYDSKSIFEDQLSAVERTSMQKGKTDLDLSLFTDGLREEVELGITIDVAYRYFSTPNRKFIIADTPGHAEFTRNMITGASTTDAVIILIDVTLGITEQTKRHSFIAGLLQLSHVIVCVNKMDLKDWNQAEFDAVVREYQSLSERFQLKNVAFVPISALKGDNVVDDSKNMDWYDGQSLMRILESIPQRISNGTEALRCLIQCELGKHEELNYYGIKLLSGELSVDTPLMVFPSNSAIQLAELMDGYAPTKSLNGSVTAKLATANDSLKRGDILATRESQPTIERTFSAMICWLSVAPFDVANSLVLQHVSGDYSVQISEIEFVVNMHSMEQLHAQSELTTNEIARVKLSFNRPMPFDAYAQHKEMGSFILIDEVTNATVAAGMIE